MNRRREDRAGVAIGLALVLCVAAAVTQCATESEGMKNASIRDNPPGARGDE